MLDGIYIDYRVRDSPNTQIGDELVIKFNIDNIFRIYKKENNKFIQLRKRSLPEEIQFILNKINNHTRLIKVNYVYKKSKCVSFYLSFSKKHKREMKIYDILK